MTTTSNGPVGSDEATPPSTTSPLAVMVMGTLSQRGTLKPSHSVVAFWGMATGSVAVLMLWAGGSDALDGLQTMTIIVAAPFVILMIGMCVSLYKDLSRDPLITGGPVGPVKRQPSATVPS